MPPLVRHPVSATVVRMALPMLAGTFAINAYNLTDTWYVSRLGVEALAAMSFTFPVVMFLGFVTRGIGTGAMTLVAQSIGAGDRRRAAVVTTHAAILCAGVAAVLAVAGLLSMDFVFQRLGASGDILALTRRYMGIWYCGMVVRVLQMMFSDVIMATGNTRAVSALMVTGTVLNVILDPIMIFGLLGFPRMGIEGAALATVLSEALVLAAAFFLVHRRQHLLLFARGPESVLRSWAAVLHIGVPSMLSSVLNPVAAGFITRTVAGFGRAAVAAVGVAGRIEMFAFMIPMTVGMSLVPFVAQNHGAGRFDRIRTAWRGTTAFALILGGAMACVFLVAARPLGRLFSTDPEVLDIMVRYISITCVGYGFLEAFRYATFTMTGLHRPILATVLNATRVVALLIPLVYFGARRFGISGLSAGRLATDVSSGIIGMLWAGWMVRRLAREARARAAASDGPPGADPEAVPRHHASPTGGDA